MLEHMLKFHDVVSIPYAPAPANNTVKWGDACKVGIESIDEQHCGLFVLHDDFVHSIERGCSPHTIDRISVELLRYADFHFHEEEEIMARLGYDGLPRHAALHQGLHRIIARLPDLPKDHNSLLVVAEFVKLWIRQHILVEDRDIVRFL